MSDSTKITHKSQTNHPQVDPLKTDGVTADNVTAPLVKILAPNSFTMHKEDFVASLNSQAELNFTPPGDKVLISSDSSCSMMILGG